ncbi:Sel1 repeat protein (plasmid) [Hoeflea sp. IMCC20628]|uniref:tetratricopeptide repeat protein n=1 Tax=Hoeflea sp. IMCC20628 TaxID=1620421 RepID=UPI00063BED1A|nr:tetratricopeptide repeat protein [Hoeflea sp. IMCC20628]AKI03414.1 Sel1 repeat protein [Hoeflea sp. IMCC20628]
MNALLDQRHYDNQMSNIHLLSFGDDKLPSLENSTFELFADDGSEHATPVAIETHDDINLAAEGGDVRAQIELACRCMGANGKPRDYAEAFRWYRMAADQGDCHAQASVGFMYLEGLGIRHNYKEAFRWFFLAAEQGDPSAQANLGWLCENGCGVPQDDEEAIRWYRLAAINKDRTRNSHLGSCIYEAAAVRSTPVPLTSGSALRLGMRLLKLKTNRKNWSDP